MAVTDQTQVGEDVAFRVITFQYFASLTSFAFPKNTIAGLELMSLVGSLPASLLFHSSRCLSIHSRKSRFFLFPVIGNWYCENAVGRLAYRAKAFHNIVMFHS